MKNNCVCINDKGFNFIRTGEVYQIERETRDFVYITNDAGSVKRYGKNRFNILEEEKPETEKKTVLKKEKEVKATCVFPKAGELSYGKTYAFTENTDNKAMINLKSDSGSMMSFTKKRFKFEQ